MPTDVIDELSDPAYAGRTHHKKSTYAKGCRGPLCRKAERDAARYDTQRAAEAAGREYKPAPPTPEQSRDELLDKIAIWHYNERGVSQPPQQRVCEICLDSL